MRTLVLSAVLLCAFSFAWTQEPTPAGKKESEGLNAAIVAARKATAEKRFADSEAMMAKVTADNPKLILPWVELGLAQLGLKKYPEAENSFKMALGVDPAPAAPRDELLGYRAPPRGDAEHAERAELQLPASPAPRPGPGQPGIWNPPPVSSTR